MALGHTARMDASAKAADRANAAQAGGRAAARGTAAFAAALDATSRTEPAGRAARQSEAPAEDRIVKPGPAVAARVAEDRRETLTEARRAAARPTPARGSDGGTRPGTAQGEARLDA
ncbi:hypothetical protein, partial [Methylobacterium symbioticum]|uniref:hypothetical protein n=1 Tax=Methylobacterium symbioticum TaxID=2584084 RepID=UPI001AED6FC7